MCSVLKRSFSSGMLENTEGVEGVALLLKHLTMIEGMDMKQITATAISKYLIMLVWETLSVGEGWLG